MAELDFTIKASVRADKGKGASRRLRHADKVPAILYGGKGEPVALEMDHNKVNNMADYEASIHILTLDIDGKKEQCILKDMQRHPFKPKLTHWTSNVLRKVRSLHTNVPLHFE